MSDALEVIDAMPSLRDCSWFLLIKIGAAVCSRLMIKISRFRKQVEAEALPDLSEEHEISAVPTFVFLKVCVRAGNGRCAFVSARVCLAVAVGGPLSLR